MKALQGKSQSTGAYYEDLDTFISIFEKLARMCQVSAAQLLTALHMMLDGDALTSFSSKHLIREEYSHAIRIFKAWYTSDAKRSRMLTAWQGMTLSKSMADSPEESEVSVLRSFVTHLMSSQKQLD